MSKQDFDVIIVGLGPVGCLATYLLARHGLTVAAIEKDTEVYKLPRAVALDGEIIRAFQPHGTAETLFGLLQKVRPGGRSGFAVGGANLDFVAFQPLGQIHEQEDETFQKVMRVNLRGVWLCSKHQIRQMLKEGRGQS